LGFEVGVLSDGHAGPKELKEVLRLGHLSFVGDGDTMGSTAVPAGPPEAKEGGIGT
jgi:hypothetical protein